MNNDNETISEISLMSSMQEDNEICLIGSVLVNPDLFDSLSDVINKDDFHWQAYSWVWEAMTELRKRGMGIDIITVKNELQRRKLLDEFVTNCRVNSSGMAGLTQAATYGESWNAMSYAANVKDYSAKRQLIQLFNLGAQWTFDGRLAQDIKNDILNKIEKIDTINSKTVDSTQKMDNTMSEAYDMAYNASRGHTAYVATGFRDLDGMLSDGFQAPDLIIIAGRPGTGKTALMTNVAINAAKHGHKVTMFTLEMSNVQIGMRFLAQETEVPYNVQKSGKLSETEWSNFTAGIEKLSTYPIRLCDLGGINIQDMRRELRRMDSDIVIVDYIQLMEAVGSHQNRVGEISEISRGLKKMAHEFDVPILAGAQLSRAVELRQGKRPILSDLRESGSLEQDSDIVMFIHPDEVKLGNVELILSKHRNGPVGSIQLNFKPHLNRFEDL